MWGLQHLRSHKDCDTRFICWFYHILSLPMFSWDIQPALRIQDLQKHLRCLIYCWFMIVTSFASFPSLPPPTKMGRKGLKPIFLHDKNAKCVTLFCRELLHFLKTMVQCWAVFTKESINIESRNGIAIYCQNVARSIWNTLLTFDFCWTQPFALSSAWIVTRSRGIKNWVLWKRRNENKRVCIFVLERCGLNLWQRDVLFHREDEQKDWPGLASSSKRFGPKSQGALHVSGGGTSLLGLTFLLGGG